MKSSLVLATLLCFTTWMSIVHATHGPVTSCCLRLSTTRVPLERIRNYRIQFEGVCQIKAVIFQTNKGRKLCSDPDSDWAKRAILKVDEKALLQQTQNEDGSTANITPAASTTSKNAPREKCRNGKRRQKKKCRRAENREQRKCV